MATIDLSRHITDFRKHYAGVRMQQGRVLTDDDFNESGRIAAEDTRRTRIDVIGPAGSPDDGFLIANPVIDAGNGRPTFTITAGSFYLGGQRVTLEADEFYHLQKDWLLQGAVAGDWLTVPNGPRFDLAYLEVWQQPVSAVEDSELFEVALGGPDTSVRVRNLRRVHVLPNVGSGDCNQAWAKLLTSLSSQGTLNQEFELVPDARLKIASEPGTGGTADLCSPPVAGGYLGAENQAIRVQLTGAGTFTWGYDNGAPLYRVQLQADDTGKFRRIKMLTEPKDQAHWPLAGQVIELLPWSAVLPNGQKISELHGHLAKATSNYNPDADPNPKTFEIDVAPPNDASGNPFGQSWKLRTGASGDASTLDDEGEFFYLRVWNRGSDTASAAKIPFTAGTPVSLTHTGLQVTFTGTQLRLDDFWIIAARPESPNVFAPWELSTGRRPHGVRRWIAPLAVINWPGGTAAGTVANDCRETFLPLTQIRSCCTVTVGDGNESHGHFTSIQDAIDSLPEKGGRVCILPGVYVETIKIVNRHDIEISGCGPRTVLRSPGPQNQEKTADPVISIIGGFNFGLECFAVEADETGLGILILGRNVFSRNEQQEAEDVVANVSLCDLSVMGGVRGALRARFVRELAVRRCEFRMIDHAGVLPCVLLLADDVCFERNLIEVVAEEIPIETPSVALGATASGGQAAAAGSPPPETFDPGVNALGGLQIEGTSERVHVAENVIRGGAGPGISLGSVRTITDPNDQGPEDEITIIIEVVDLCASKDPIDVVITIPSGGNNQTQVVSTGDLDDICLERNHIYHTGGSGISTYRFFDLKGTDEFITVVNLTIRENRIEQCLQRQITEATAAVAPYIGYGGIALADVENLIVHDNVIQENGLGPQEPVCGIFVLHVEGADFSRNRVLDNGVAAPNAVSVTGNATPKRGHRGGIVIAFALAPTRTIQLHSFSGLATSAPAQTGVPAVRVHDNIVTTPLGQALFINALGPVTVEDNQLTTRGLAPGLGSLSLFAATVWILNLGFSNEYYLQYLAFSMIGAKNQGQTDPGGALLTASLDDFSFGRVMANGQVLFSGNTVNTDLFAIGHSFSVSGILILTMDDIGFHDNQCEANLFLLDDFLISHVFLFGASLRATSNRIKEGMYNAILSAITLGLLSNTTALNQGTHCIIALGGNLEDRFNTATVGVNPLLNLGLDHPLTCGDMTKLFADSFAKMAGAAG